MHAPNSGCAPGSRLENWLNVLKQVKYHRENAGNATVQVLIVINRFHGLPRDLLSKNCESVFYDSFVNRASCVSSVLAAVGLANRVPTTLEVRLPAHNLQVNSQGIF